MMPPPPLVSSVLSQSNENRNLSDGLAMTRFLGLLDPR
jgi:hypothetical protein